MKNPTGSARPGWLWSLRAETRAASEALHTGPLT
jgi:hypothetical protein